MIMLMKMMTKNIRLSRIRRRGTLFTENRTIKVDNNNYYDSLSSGQVNITIKNLTELHKKSNQIFYA